MAKPKTPAQVAAERKVAVEKAKVNAQKNAANKAKVQANATKVAANKAKVTAPKATVTKKVTSTKSVTGPAVKVTATKPMKKVTGAAVTVTGKRNMAKPNEGPILLVKENGKARQVTRQEYNTTKLPKDEMQRDASGYIVQKGSGGTRTKIDYAPLKGWSKW